MISTEFSFIFLHAPKTGGNSIHHTLLPFSDDAFSLSAHQDGVDRFEIIGDTTPHKHAQLQDYANRLKEDLASYAVVLSVRHPFERFVSWYFSPHRWMRQDDNGGWIKTPPVWDEEVFIQHARNQDCLSLSAFLLIDGLPQQPDHLIRFENLQNDFQRLTQKLSLSTAALPHVNRTAAPKRMVQDVLESHQLRDTIEDIYQDDMHTFGYAPYHLPSGL